MGKYIQCKDCGRIFAYVEDHQLDFLGNARKVPTRCAWCLERIKERRKDPYWGWESTMGSSASIKRRRRRVNYAVHVVGGFR